MTTFTLVELLSLMEVISSQQHIVSTSSGWSESHRSLITLFLFTRPEELRVRLGEWDVHSDTETYTNVEMDVLSIHYHPEFHPGNLYNDIAVVKLDGVVDFQKNPHISPICLPDKFQVNYSELKSRFI